MNSYLSVDGAKLYYQVEGDGPVLLISQSGEGDADRSNDLVARLADSYTVVTYDRRGLSRSAVDDPGGPVTIRRHADDAAAVLAEVTDRPALMLGLSLGAAIGLHMLAADPGRIAKLIAHEPIALGFLDGARADTTRTTLRAVQQVHQRDGWRAAAGAVAAALGIDPRHQETEPDITAFPFTGQRAANFEYFLTTDLAAAITDTLTLGEVSRTAPIVPAVGTTSPADGFDYLSGLALADHLGVTAQRFPGGHNGNLTHPRAFAEQVVAVLG
ncbi:MAG: alpha/beta hydrolase [Catenulispora sp.]|nr:alpha/beta hydrolase [Catenulispora sp.]